MSSKTIEILAGEPRVIKSPQGEFTVHELTWLQLLGFVEKLGSAAGEFVSQTEAGLVLDRAKLADVVRTSGALIIDLVSKAAKLKPEEIEKLSPRMVLALADAALEVNCTPDLFAAGNAVAARFAQVLRPAAKSAA